MGLERFKGSENFVRVCISFLRKGWKDLKHNSICGFSWGEYLVDGGDFPVVRGFQCFMFKGREFSSQMRSLNEMFYAGLFQSYCGRYS